MSSEMIPGLVSVIVASYNHAGYLRRRMDSLIGQNYENIEILVIDDRSPDNSVEILREYAEHPKVNLIVREQNGGWITVSNQGVELAHGEYIIFANCDDACDVRMIQHLVAAMERSPAVGVAFCRSRMVDEDDVLMGDDFQVRERSFRARCATDTVLSGDEMLAFLRHSCVIPNLSAALIRRECFAQVGMLSFDYKACSDWDLFLRIGRQFDFAYVAEPLNDFRQHKSTIRSATKGKVTFDEFFRVLLGEKERVNWRQRCWLRQHVMYLWAIDLVRPSADGIRNFVYLFKRVYALDAPALLFLPLSILRRLLELPAKALARLVPH